MRLPPADAIPAAVVALGLFVLAEDAGGYFPVSWGWAAVGFLFALIAGLILRSELELGRRDYGLLLGFAAFVGWAALSTLWGSSLSQTVPELQRSLVYLAALAAFLVLSRCSPAPLLAGVLVASTAVSLHALQIRVFPRAPGREIFAGRLAAPVDYPNGLALIAVLGILVALGFLLERPPPVVRALVSAILVPLALTLYLTFSRGGVVALVVGLLVLALFDLRLRAFVTAALATAAPALAVWLAAADGEVSTGAEPARPFRLVVVLILLMTAGGLLGSISRRIGVSLIAVGVVLAAAALAFSPVATDVPASRDVEAAAPATSVAEISRQSPADRLRVWRDPVRSEYWRVAWEVFDRHPVLGAGAGSYESHWYRLRRQPEWVRDAHSIVLETLAELGLVGAVLLVAAFGIPLASLGRLRRERRLAGAAAAYTAFLAHSAIDWDWELPAVTVAGLACGAALVVAVRSGAPRSLGAMGRALALAASSLALLLALAGVVSGAALARAYTAAGAGDWATVERSSRTASRWAPWSSDAVRLRGEAAIARNDIAAARSYFRDAIAKDPSSWLAWARLAAVADGEERRNALLAASVRNPLHIPSPAREDP